MYRQIHCSNSSPILELSVKFASQICHENINKPLDGAFLADFGISPQRSFLAFSSSRQVSISNKFVHFGIKDET